MSNPLLHKNQCKFKTLNRNITIDSTDAIYKRNAFYPQNTFQFEMGSLCVRVCVCVCGCIYVHVYEQLTTVRDH